MTYSITNTNSSSTVSGYQSTGHSAKISYLGAVDSSVGPYSLVGKTAKAGFYKLLEVVGLKETSAQTRQREDSQRHDRMISKLKRKQERTKVLESLKNGGNGHRVVEGRATAGGTGGTGGTTTGSTGGTGGTTTSTGSGTGTTGFPPTSSPTPAPTPLVTSSPTAAPTNQPTTEISGVSGGVNSNPKKDDNTGKIIGYSVAAGSAALLAGLGCLVGFLKRNKKPRDEEVTQDADENPSFHMTYTENYRGKDESEGYYSRMLNETFKNEDLSSCKSDSTSGLDSDDYSVDGIAYESKSANVSKVKKSRVRRTDQESLNSSSTSVLDAGTYSVDNASYVEKVSLSNSESPSLGLPC